MARIMCLTKSGLEGKTRRRASFIVIACMLALAVVMTAGCWKKERAPKAPKPPVVKTPDAPKPPKPPAPEAPAAPEKPAAAPEAPAAPDKPAAPPEPPAAPEAPAAAPAPPPPAAPETAAAPDAPKPPETAKAEKPEEPMPAPKPPETAKVEKPEEPKPGPKPPKGVASTDFNIEVDSTGEVVKVVGEGKAEARLDKLLKQAYETDQKTTSKVVKSWMTDNEILKAEDVRDLLDESWNRDSKEATRVIRPWFVERMTLEITDIPALLTKAWSFDAGSTRDVLRTWGGTYGFVDVSDAEALRGHKLIAADDIDQIRKAVRSYHQNNWTKVAGAPVSAAGSEGAPAAAATLAAAPAGASELDVQVSWATPRRIAPKSMRFSLGDDRFSSKKDAACTLTPKDMPDAGIPVIVDCGVDLPAGWVQVQDEDFVVIAARFRKIDVPERNSAEWKELLKLGVVPGTLFQ